MKFSTKAGPPIEEEVLEKADPERAEIVKWMLMYIWEYNRLPRQKVLRHLRGNYGFKYIATTEHGNPGVDRSLTRLMHRAAPNYVKWNGRERWWYRNSNHSRD